MAKFDWDFNFTNIGQFYECFLRHGSQNAVKQCLSFVDFNANELVSDLEAFSELPYKLVVVMLFRDTFCAKEVNICKALIEWHKKHQQYDRNDLFRCIRWNLISNDEYYAQIRDLQFISDEQYFSFTLRKYPPRIRRIRNSTQEIEAKTNNAVNSVCDSRANVKRNGFTRKSWPVKGSNGVTGANYSYKVVKRSATKIRVRVSSHPFGYKRAVIVNTLPHVELPNGVNSRSDESSNATSSSFASETVSNDSNVISNEVQQQVVESISDEAITPENCSAVIGEKGESESAVYNSINTASNTSRPSLVIEKRNGFELVLTPISPDKNATICDDSTISCDSNEKSNSVPMKKSKKKKFLISENPSQNTFSFDTESQKFRCDVCCTLFGRRDHVKRHLLLHSEPKFKCALCDRRWHTRELLYDHEKGHQVNHTCNRCGKTGFATYSNILGHQKNSKCRLLDAAPVNETVADAFDLSETEIFPLI